MAELISKVPERLNGKFGIEFNYANDDLKFDFREFCLLFNIQRPNFVFKEFFIDRNLLRNNKFDHISTDFLSKRVNELMLNTKI